LDNAFRNKLPIEFKHGGRVWRADTPQEAIELRSLLEFKDARAHENGEEVDYIEDQLWTHDTVMDLLKGIGAQQMAFLLALEENNGSMFSDQVCKQLQLGSELVLAGVLSGLSKQVKKLGLRPEDLFRVTIHWKGKDKARSFRLNSHFEWIAANLGWPENWRPQPKTNVAQLTETRKGS
jgi:hypothetical protein